MLRGLPGNPTSSLPGGLASSPCCLALDSSSSFPCPAFLAIAKSKNTLLFLMIAPHQDPDQQEQDTTPESFCGN
ncbi:hypothetical protein STEG23_021629 [Scotinomys teguina]